MQMMSMIDGVGGDDSHDDADECQVYLDNDIDKDGDN